jgi:WhiB family transcriptional regulator, redox-sensing transcriptional regulator
MKTRATYSASEEWRDQAECAGMDTNLFFPVTDADAAAPKRVCAVCPVRQECLEWAIATRQSDGVWGGMTEDERRRLRRRRQEAERAGRRAEVA